MTVPSHENLAVDDIPVDTRVENAREVHKVGILTVNTHKGFTSFNRRFILPELRDAVRAVSADVVFLQEVIGTHEKHASRYGNWPAAPQYEFLADTMWPQFAYGRNAVYPDGHHGNAVLSKYPISHYQNLDVSITGPEKRGLLHCVLELPQHHQMHAICVHLGLRENHRQQQLSLLCDLIASLPADAPVVIAGDFNDWRLRASPILESRAGMREVFEQAFGRSPKSFPAKLPLLRLDRVYVRNAVAHEPRILSARPWSHLSDHLPLAVELHI